MKISKSFTLEQETIDMLNELKKRHGSSSVSSLIDRVFLEIKIRGNYTLPSDTSASKNLEKDSINKVKEGNNSNITKVNSSTVEENTNKQTKDETAQKIDNTNKPDMIRKLMNKENGSQ